MLHHYDPRIFFLVTLMSADQQLYTSIVNTAVKLQIIAFASLILGWPCSTAALGFFEHSGV